MVTDVNNVLVGLNEVALELLKGMKLGLIGDFEQFWNDYQTNTDLKAKLAAAFASVSACPAELGQMGVLDVVELVSTEVSYVPRLIAALSPAPAPAA